MAPTAIDIEKFLHFFQDLYAYALTLKELIESEDDRQYDDVKPKYDRKAAEQFELFFRALNDPQAFSKVVKAFLDTHPMPPSRVQ